MATTSARASVLCCHCLNPLRLASAASQPHLHVRRTKATMSAWQIHSYGGTQELTQSHTLALPVLRCPDDVLIKIHAASVNPIDTLMIDGYGASTLNGLRCVSKATGLDTSPELPLTPGRDFSGVVAETGRNIPSSRFRVGDEVWGAVNATRPGTHAQYVVVSTQDISRKPVSISHVEAASLPYVAATTWASLCTLGCLSENKLRNKRVLVIGGSGGIGTFVIQLLKAWGAEVTTTCSTDAVESLLALGADVAFDYNTHDVRTELHRISGFDVIFDAIGGEMSSLAMELLKPYTLSSYITVVNPLLRNNDQLGLPFGLAKSSVDFGLEALKGLQKGICYGWGFFIPDGKALHQVAALVDRGKIAPVVEKIFAFDDLPAAYEKVQAKHNRGKTVIDMLPTDSQPPS